MKILLLLGLSVATSTATCFLGVAIVVVHGGLNNSEVTLVSYWYFVQWRCWKRLARSSTKHPMSWLFPVPGC
jgi:hypothetical protein